MYKERQASCSPEWTEKQFVQTFLASTSSSDEAQLSAPSSSALVPVIVLTSSPQAQRRTGPKPSIPAAPLSLARLESFVGRATNSIAHKPPHQRHRKVDALSGLLGSEDSLPDDISSGLLEEPERIEVERKGTSERSALRFSFLPALLPSFELNISSPTQMYPTPSSPLHRPEREIKGMRSRFYVHDLEPLEIRALLPSLKSGSLLGPGGSLPLGNNVRSLELLLDSGRSSGSGKRLEEVRGEDHVLEGQRLSGNRGRGSVNEGLDLRTKKKREENETSVSVCWEG